jgi:hypothetical protein
VSQIKIYIDEDAMDSDLVAALRSRGVTVITALDAGLAGKPDGEQLAFAVEHGCVLYTFNVSDFTDFTPFGPAPGENMPE